MMSRLLLGLIALPLTVLVYIAWQRLLPRILEPLPEPRGVDGFAETDAPTHRRRISLSSRQVMAMRGGAAALVLAGIAFAVARAPRTGPPNAGAPVPRAAEIQLPPPAPLQVQLRFAADGSGDGQLHDPRDIAVDQSGNVYIADTGNKRIVKFNSDGTMAGQWRSSAKGAFVEPSALAVVKDGVVVDDSEAAQLYKFDFNGQPIAAYQHDTPLSHPRGIAAGPDGAIYVGDTANSRIFKLGADGTPLGAFDTKGVKLEQPTGVAVDEQGNVYSIEPAASRIQKFAPDGSLQASMFLPSTVTLYPPRAAWIPGRGLIASLPDQNELLAYGPAGTPEAAFVPQPDPGAAPLRRPLGLATAPGNGSVWLIWNASATVTQLNWPG